MAQNIRNLEFFRDNSVFNFAFPSNKRKIPLIKNKIDSSYFKLNIRPEKCRNRFLYQIWDSIEIRKIDFKEGFILVFPLNSTKTSGLISFIKFANNVVPFIEDGGRLKCKTGNLYACFTTQVMHQKQRQLRSFYLLELNPNIIRNIGFHFLYRSFNEKDSTCGQKILDWTDLDFDSRRRNFKEPELQEIVKVLVSPDGSSILTEADVNENLFAVIISSSNW